MADAIDMLVVVMVDVLVAKVVDAVDMLAIDVADVVNVADMFVTVVDTVLMDMMVGVVTVDVDVV